MGRLCFRSGRGHRRLRESHPEVRGPGEVDGLGRGPMDQGSPRSTSEAFHTQGVREERAAGGAVPLSGVHAQQRPQLQRRAEGEGGAGYVSERLLLILNKRFLHLFFLYSVILVLI